MINKKIDGLEGDIPDILICHMGPISARTVLCGRGFREGPRSHRGAVLRSTDVRSGKAVPQRRRLDDHYLQAALQARRQGTSEL